MPLDKRVLRALDLKKLRLPPYPKVVRFEAEDYTDSTGDASLRVLVVLDEDTDVDKLPGKMVGALKSAIRESLRRQGLELFAYIFLAKPSELAEAVEEE